MTDFELSLNTAVCHRCLERPATQTCNECFERFYCSRECQIAAWTSEHYSQCSYTDNMHVPGRSSVRPLRLVILLPPIRSLSTKRVTFLGTTNNDGGIKTYLCRRVDHVFACDTFVFGSSIFGSFWMIDECWDLPLSSSFDVYTIAKRWPGCRPSLRLESRGTGTVFGAIYQCDAGTIFHCNDRLSPLRPQQLHFKHMQVQRIKTTSVRRHSYRRGDDNKSRSCASYWFVPQSGQASCTLLQLMQSQQFKRLYGIINDSKQPNDQQVSSEQIGGASPTSSSGVARFIGNTRHHSSLAPLAARGNPRIALVTHDNDGDELECICCGVAQCVRYLPCKHAPMCRTCSDETLVRYRVSCPMCRTKVARLQVLPQFERKPTSRGNDATRLCSSAL